MPWKASEAWVSNVGGDFLESFLVLSRIFSLKTLGFLKGRLGMRLDLT